MKRSTLSVSVMVVAMGLVGIFAHAPSARAQEIEGSSTLLAAPNLLKVNWYGPDAITPHDTVRVNYTNLGIDEVKVEWAVTNAQTGELVCHNFGKPVTVPAGKGVFWDYSQTLEVDPKDGLHVETRHCAGVDEREEPGEVYFDATGRHNLVEWTFVQHQSVKGLRNAVDLGTVELFNSMIMPDGTRSMSFGRTIEVIHANPTAPGDYPRLLLPR